MKTVTTETHEYDCAIYNILLTNGKWERVNIIPRVMRNHWTNEWNMPFYTRNPKELIEGLIENGEVYKKINMSQVIRYELHQSFKKEFVVEKIETSYFGMPWSFKWRVVSSEKK